jgi:hypothetical protein
MRYSLWKCKLLVSVVTCRLANWLYEELIKSSLLAGKTHSAVNFSNCVYSFANLWIPFSVSSPPPNHAQFHSFVTSFPLNKHITLWPLTPDNLYIRVGWETRFHTHTIQSKWSVQDQRSCSNQMNNTFEAHDLFLLTNIHFSWKTTTFVSAVYYYSHLAYISWWMLSTNTCVLVLAINKAFSVAKPTPFTLFPLAIDKVMFDVA